MGMDAFIFKARTRKVFSEEDWWNNPEVTEEWYARKPWEILNHCNFIPRDYESGDFIELTVENVENMIEVACQYRNYWGNYDDVPKLCELRDKMIAEINGYEEGGPTPMHYYLEYDW